MKFLANSGEGAQQQRLTLRLCFRKRQRWLLSPTRKYDCHGLWLDTPSSNVAEHFLRNIYIPYLDHVIVELDGRFQDGRSTAMKLQALVASRSVDASFIDIAEAVEFYAADLPEPEASVVSAEFRRWSTRWSETQADKRPTSALDSLVACDSHFYPNICVLLRIFCTLPVSTASVERTFSTLRRLKTYLRSTMGAERLAGLAHLSVNRDISAHLTVDSVIDCLARSSNTRLDFIV